MASRASLNKVLLIGNLTRDPELRYTPSGAAVCTFGLATNRTYVASDGTKREEAEFIKIVSWNKLAELCSQLLAKGRKVYVEGRLQTRSWETQDGQPRQTTEVVIDDMRILDSKKSFEEQAGVGTEDILEESKVVPDQVQEEPADQPAGKEKVEKQAQDLPTKGTKRGKTTATKKQTNSKEDKQEDEKVDLDDLPF